MKPKTSLRLFAVLLGPGALGLAPLALHAAPGTWTGATDGTWETATNWSVNPAPGSTSILTSADIATFDAASINSTITIDSNRNIRSLSFNLATGAYTIGSAGANAGNPLTLASGGTITLPANTITTTGNTQTINAPVILAPTSGTGAGSYQFINSTAVANNNNLLVAGNISGGTTTQGVALTLSGTNTGSNVLSGVISNGNAALGLSLSKVNSAIFSLTGTNNSFTGGLNVGQGILQVDSISNSGTNSSIGAGGGITALTASGGTGTLRITGAGGTTDRAITIVRSGSGNGSGLVIDSSGSAPVTFSGGITSSTTAAVSTTVFNTLTLAGSNTGANTISGSITDFNVTLGNERLVAVTKSNTAAQWILSGTASNYSGPTTISGGTLAGIGANAFGNTSGISIAGSGILSLRGDTGTSFVRLTGGAAITATTTANNATINVDQATVSGTAPKTMTIGSLTINTAVINQTNFTGANNTSLTTGAVTTGNSASGTETINNTNTNGTLTFASLTVNRTGTPTVAFIGNGNTTISGALTETAITKLTKSGNGTLTLSGSSTYTGTTTINAGKLSLAPTGSIATGLVTVNNGSTLSGTGGIGGDVTVASGGRLAFEVAANSGSQDPLNITGALTVDASNFIDLTTAATPANGDYILATASGGLTFTSDVVNLGSIVGSVSAVGNNLVLTVAGGSSGYTSWASDKGLTALNNSPNLDPEFDGISNVLEYILGGDPLASSTSILPQQTLDATNIVLTLTRSDDSEADTVQTVQFSTDLVNWSNFATLGPVSSGAVTITENAGIVPDGVSVAIPRTNAVGGKLFARLRGVKP